MFCFLPLFHLSKKAPYIWNYHCDLARRRRKRRWRRRRRRKFTLIQMTNKILMCLVWHGKDVQLKFSSHVSWHVTAYWLGGSLYGEGVLWCELTGAICLIMLSYLPRMLVKCYFLNFRSLLIKDPVSGFVLASAWNQMQRHRDLGSPQYLLHAINRLALFLWTSNIALADRWNHPTVLV